MKFYKIISFFALAGFLTIGSLQAVTESASSSSEARYGLPQKCINILKPHLEKLGMSLADLNNKTKGAQFRNYYMKRSEWENIRAACQPELSSEGGCDGCGKECIGNCACFFTWCWYNCPCK